MTKQKQMANLYTTQSALPVGTVLKGSNDSYMLLKTLGQGSLGITYLVKNIVGEDEVEQLFCIKEFLCATSMDAKVRL